MMDEYDELTQQLHEELDEYDVEKSLQYVAAICGYKDYKDYETLSQQPMSDLNSSALVTNMIAELSRYVALSRGLQGPTELNELLRRSLANSIETLVELRNFLVLSHRDYLEAAEKVEKEEPIIVKETN